MTARWLSIVGIGEDGVSGLCVAARQRIAQAERVIGGSRHLALADTLISGVRQTWPSPIADAIPRLLAHRPAPVVALASGDPFCFGVGPMLAEAAGPGGWDCLPSLSCLTLACSRLGWSQQDVGVISFCGRPLDRLAALLHPGSRILALSEDDSTPAAVAAFLRARGFGPSAIVLMEALGGPDERVRPSVAEDFDMPSPHRLNLLAITLAAVPGTPVPSLAPGRPDDAFAHDGQITKREIRAATLAALAPARCGLLWDIGTGSGSIAIEWMLSHPSCRAIAIDRHGERLARAADNATRLGVPGLRVVSGAAPEALADLPQPDAIFIGGGAQTPGLIDHVWLRLRRGGVLVANSVTIETDAVLFDGLGRHGGTLTRIGVERLGAVGRMHGYRPAMTVTQWTATKS